MFFRKFKNNITIKWNETLSDCNYMLSELTNILSIDLSNFDSSKVTDMQSMFEGCSSLISLDLSKLDTSSVTIMNFMFYNCNSLIFLDLSHFKFNTSLNFDYMFQNCNKSLLYCIGNETNMSDVFFSYISKTLGNNNCSDICFSENKKIIVEKKKCTLNCSDDDIYKYEYNKRCYENYQNETQSAIFSSTTQEEILDTTISI